MTDRAHPDAGSLLDVRLRHLAYLRKRGFGDEAIKRFRLGYAPGRGTLVEAARAAGFTAAWRLHACVDTLQEPPCAKPGLFALGD